MDLLYDIHYEATELFNLALEIAEPHLLEVIISMILLTFMLGFVSSYK